MIYFSACSIFQISKLLACKIMWFWCVISFKIMKICLHGRDGRYKGIPSQLPQDQSQILKERKPNTEVPPIYSVASSTNNSFFIEKDKMVYMFHLQSLRASWQPPSKGQRASPLDLQRARALSDNVRDLRHRWRAQGQGLNFSPNRRPTSYPAEPT